MAGCSKQIFVWNTLLRVLPPGRDIVKHILWGVIRVFLSLLSLLLRQLVDKNLYHAQVTQVIQGCSLIYDVSLLLFEFTRLTKFIRPGCGAVQICRQMPAFRENFLLPSSVYKRSDKITGFGDLTPCILVEKYDCFDRNSCHRLYRYTLKMEAVGSPTVLIVRLSTKVRDVNLQPRIILFALL